MSKPLKLSLIVGGLLVIVVVWYVNTVNLTSNPAYQATLTDSIEVHRPVAEQVTAKQTVPESSVDTLAVPAEKVQESAQVDEVLSWQAARGWYDTSNETSDDYKTYSEEVLKQLADNGDIKALHLLARWAPLDESSRLLTKAAVRGSTFALFGLSNHVDTGGELVPKKMPEDKRRLALKEAAAYIQVAAMRGDLMNAKFQGISSLEFRYDMKLTDQDLEQVKNRAQEIYDSLESERIALGLGKFDNSIPPAIKVYFRASGVEVED
jgi:hypothetical protein